MHTVLKTMPRNAGDINPSTFNNTRRVLVWPAHRGSAEKAKGLVRNNPPPPHKTPPATAPFQTLWTAPTTITTHSSTPSMCILNKQVPDASRPRS